MYNGVRYCKLFREFLNIEILHNVFANFNIGVKGLLFPWILAHLQSKLLFKSLLCGLSDIELGSQRIIERLNPLFWKFLFQVLLCFLDEEGLRNRSLLLLFHCFRLSILVSFGPSINRLCWTHSTGSVIVYTILGIAALVLEVLSVDWNTTLSSHWFHNSVVNTRLIARIILLRNLLHWLVKQAFITSLL